ncbi:MAG TPA: hypothetical protein VIH18_11400, partial [Candidatus Binatia bacterium]
AVVAGEIANHGHLVSATRHACWLLRLQSRQRLATDALNRIKAAAEVGGSEFNRSSYLVRRSSLIQERQQLKNYLKSLVEAYDLSKKEPTQAYKAIQRFTGITDSETLALTYKSCMEYFCQRIPYVSPAGMRFAANFLKETRPDMKAKIDKIEVERILDNSILKDVSHEVGGGL